MPEEGKRRSAEDSTDIPPAKRPAPPPTAAEEQTAPEAEAPAAEEAAPAWEPAIRGIHWAQWWYYEDNYGACQGPFYPGAYPNSHLVCFLLSGIKRQ